MIAPDETTTASQARKADANAKLQQTRKARFRRWLWRKTPFIFVFLLVSALALLLLWPRIVIIIEPGKAGVLFRLFSGTQIDYVYPEGLKIVSPLNTMYIYETRKQIALHEFDVLTARGLTVRLSLAIRYQPEVELLGMLHQRIGPDYLQRVIIPQAESVMRKQLGGYTAEEVYTNKEGLLTKAILLALEEVGRNFVKVEEIIIRSITLPVSIKNAIEDKLTQEELLKSYEFRTQIAAKEAERMRLEAEGIRAYHEIIDKSLTDKNLTYQGILATKELSKSANAKIVVIGGGKNGMPLILNTQQQ
jgi:regulator of protease activity HflC (stomatin/prohibitin superfamily)